jgi:hypothetical protein
MGSVEAPGRAPFPGDKAPVVHVSQAVVAALGFSQSLRVLVRSANSLAARSETAWVLPRRWVGRPTDTASLVWRALDGSRIPTRNLEAGVASAKFDQASSVRPAGGLLSVVITALVPEAVVPARDWTWVGIDQLEETLGAWDIDALAAARVKARDLLRDADVAVRQLPEAFAIGDLRRLYEAHWDLKINASNFARLATKPGSGFLEPVEQNKGRLGRPAMLYRRGTGPAPSLSPG